MEPSDTEDALDLSKLSFSLPAPSTQAVSTVVTTRQVYAESGKLALFTNPSQSAHYPARRFIPSPEGLFQRIRTNDNKDGWEAETLWNTGNNLDLAIASIHELALALNSGDSNSAVEVTSVLNHYLTAAYERIQERVDFFTKSLESGKSEAILLQKYLR